jgi:hypothetical protein
VKKTGAENAKMVAGKNEAHLIFYARPNTPSENPKGIMAQSPGLRGTSYPGYRLQITNRNAVVASPFLQRQDLCHKAFGIVSPSKTTQSSPGQSGQP